MRRFLILLNLTELSFELGAGGWSGSTGGFRSGGGVGFTPRTAELFPGRVGDNLINTTISNPAGSRSAGATSSVTNAISNNNAQEWPTAHRNRHGFIEIVFIRSVHEPNPWGVNWVQ